jgi:hypothetical protein
MGRDDSAITLYDAHGEHPLGRGPKLELARKLIEHVAARIGSAAPESARQGLPPGK